MKMKAQLMRDFAQEDTAGMEAVSLTSGGCQQRGGTEPPGGRRLPRMSRKILTLPRLRLSPTRHLYPDSPIPLN